MSQSDRMVAAVNNYLSVAAILHEDLIELDEAGCFTTGERRHFLRAATALLEGCAHCYLEICAIGAECECVTLTAREVALLQNMDGENAADRVKLALRLLHRMIPMGDPPDFGGADWANARDAIIQRHRLMHPKSPHDLTISDEDWGRFAAGIRWLQGQEFRFVRLMYGIRERSR